MKIINITAETSLAQVAEFLQKIAINTPYTVAVIDQNSEELIKFDGVGFSGCSTSNTNGIETTTLTLTDETLDIAKRVEALEETQGAQDDAIADLGEAVSNIVEG